MGGAVGGIIGGVGSIIGGAMGADASSDAARAQRQAADRATEEQRRQYDQTREDMAPWRDTGGAALNRLAYMMGIGGYGSGGGGQSQNWLTEAQIREQLTPQFTSKGPSNSQSNGLGLIGLGLNNRPQYVTVYDGTGNDQDSGRQVLFSGGQTAPQVDEAGLNAAVQKRLQEQQAQQQAAESAARQAAQSDPAFGSLLRRFTMDDYQEDPGYQFRLQQGEQAINRAAAAAGRYDSGRALKDLGEFNSGMASQEFGNAYNRWNNDQTNIFNRLSGVAGTGQQAANQLAHYGANMTNNIAGNIVGAGNAAAAGQMGAANAWSGALGNTANALSQYFSGRGPNLGISAGSQFNMNGLASGGFNPSFSARL